MILTDEEENWRRDEYHTELLGTELRLKFSTAKLLDYTARWEELEQSDNPLAVVVLALLAARVYSFSASNSKSRESQCRLSRVPA